MLILERLFRNTFAPKNDLDSTLGTHDRHFGRWPSIVEVAAQMLGRHHIVRTAICLPCDDRNLGDARLGVGEQELGPISDDTVVFLCTARKEARHIHKGDNGDVEAVAKPHEARGLDGRIDVKASGKLLGLIRNDPHSSPLHSTKASDDVLRKIG
eukprot:scaffold258507_cov30-Tisochrysis_lutea.AAC.2